MKLFGRVSEGLCSRVPAGTIWSAVLRCRRQFPSTTTSICRSGKSSIERVIFHKMSPHETLFLESTHNVDIHMIANNDFMKFQTWDFGGDMNLEVGVNYQGKTITPEMILKGCSTLVYVIDAQEEDYEDSLPKLVETIIAAHKVNPKIHFEVFLHKVDGDMMPEELRAERQQGIQNYVSGELAESSGDVLVSYYLTSIYDHSALEAFSKVRRIWCCWLIVGPVDKYGLVLRGF